MGVCIACKALTIWARLVLSDAFGLVDGYPNPKLVADDWAAQGYRVLFPDILGGDPMPIDMLVRPLFAFLACSSADEEVPHCRRLPLPTRHSKSKRASSERR